MAKAFLVLLLHGLIRLAEGDMPAYYENGVWHLGERRYGQNISSDLQQQPAKFLALPADFSETLTFNFTGQSYLEYTVWHVIDGATPDRSVRYIPECAHIASGYLHITSGAVIADGPNAAYHPVGKVESRESGFQYGSVEWIMRVRPATGIKYILSLVSHNCGENEGRDTCDILTNPAIAFVYRDSAHVTSVLFQFDQVTNVWDPNHLEFTNFTLTENHESEFHTYRILWTDQVLVWLIDDTETLRITDKKRIPTAQMHVSMGAAPLFDPSSTDTTSAEVKCSNARGMDISSLTIRRKKETDLDYIVVQADVRQNKDSTAKKKNMYADEKVSAVRIAVPVSVCFVVLLICAAGFFVSRKIQNARSQKQIRMMRKSATPQRPSVDFRYSNMLHNETLTNQPGLCANFVKYTRLMEVCRDSVEISEQVLGKGEFGIVFKGLAHRLPTVTKGPTEVAVKTLMHTAKAEMQRAFTDELITMTKIGRHRNVVNLLGIVSLGTPLLLLEYCRFGSLNLYLADHRDGRVYEHVDESGCMMPFSENEMKDRWLAVCSVSTFKSGDLKTDMLSTTDLLAFAHQISRGMEHLARRSIIHRDLAARNVLVADNRILKVSDFGLAKSGQSNYTVSNLLVPLPVLWMPPEAISGGSFSQSSDVWSFGILLWEIFSLGRSPFSDLDLKNFSLSSLTALLLSGYQMTRTSGTPNEIYAMMKECWNLGAAQRPRFTDLEQRLDCLLSSCTQTSVRNYLMLDEEVTEVVAELQCLDNEELQHCEDKTGAMEDTLTSSQLPV